MNQYVLKNGRKISIGAKLGQGGEGAVYQINGQANQVAKIYSKPLEFRHQEKLETIFTLRTNRLSEVCAWPIEAIYANRSMCGFVMPKVDKPTEIHELFGISSRKRQFPNADWAFLIHVAKNLSAAVQNLHSANIVIGDFNQRNTVVSDDGTIRLWDCDSFQVEKNGRTFYCTVGVPEFTPPELQSTQSFDGIRRTPQHDRFSLAVMIFYLLFLGRHPFAGDPTDPKITSLDLQDAIAGNKFAYSPNASNFGIRAPRNSPPVRELGSILLPLFSRAFETTNRPTAAEWFSELSKLGGQLSRCQVNPGHVFSNSSSRCPWCTYEANWGLITFLPTACPPRFVKTFDVPSLISSVNYCFQDFNISIPGECKGFTCKPLPAISLIANSLYEQVDKDQTQLQYWTEEIKKLKALGGVSPQIDEIIRVGRIKQKEQKKTQSIMQKLLQDENKLRKKRESIGERSMNPTISTQLF